MDIFSWILALATLTGQLIKLPISSGGVSILDITVIILCLWGILKIKFKLKKPPLFIVSAASFIAIATLSLILTPLHLNIQEYLTSFLYIFRFAVYILLGWLIFSRAFPAIKNNTPQILIFSGLGLAILGLMQFIILPDLGFLTKDGWDPHYFRTVSTFLDPNFAGAFFVLTLILPRQSSVLSLIVYLALMTTFSRSSYLMFLASGLILAFLKRSKILALATFVLFGILLLGFQIYSILVATPRGIDRIKSAEFRLNTWQQGWTLFQNHPLLGVGFNAYRYAIREYNLGDAEFLKSHGSNSNDSSLLFVASTTGAVGFIIYLFFMGTLLKEGHIVLKASIVGLLVQSTFSNSLFFPPILLWLILNASSPKK